MNEGRAPKGKVIVFSDEDDVADTLAPRLEAAGADRIHVEIIKMVREEGSESRCPRTRNPRRGRSLRRGAARIALLLDEPGLRLRIFSLISDLEALQQKIKSMGDVKLVIIDPISAYFGGVGKVDSFRTTDVRAVLTPLVTLAAELKVAMIGVMHFNKKLDITNALLRISDSLAFGAGITSSTRLWLRWGRASMAKYD
jgi:putative DNA primase/helicase